MQTTAELPVVEKMLILAVMRKQLFLAIGFDNMILTKQFLLRGEKKHRYLFLVQRGYLKTAGLKENTPTSQEEKERKAAEFAKDL